MISQIKSLKTESLRAEAVTGAAKILFSLLSSTDEMCSIEAGLVKLVVAVTSPKSKPTDKRVLCEMHRLLLEAVGGLKHTDGSVVLDDETALAILAQMKEMNCKP